MRTTARERVRISGPASAAAPDHQSPPPLLRLSHVRIGVADHLERIKTRPLDFRDHPIANEAFDGEEKNQAEPEHHEQAGNDPDQLRDQLSAVAKENSAYRARHSVPSFAVAP